MLSGCVFENLTFCALSPLVSDSFQKLRSSVSQSVVHLVDSLPRFLQLDCDEQREMLQKTFGEAYTALVHSCVDRIRIKSIFSWVSRRLYFCISAECKYRHYMMESIILSSCVARFLLQPNIGKTCAALERSRHDFFLLQNSRIPFTRMMCIFDVIVRV